MTRKLVSKKIHKKAKPIPWLPLLCIALLFLAPLFISKCLKTDNDPFKKGSVNRANTLTPPISLQDTPLMAPHGRPGLIYVAPTSCQETCLSNIGKMLRIKEAMGRSGQNLYLMIVTSQDDADKNPVYKMIKKQYPIINYIALSPEDLQRFFNALPIGTQNLSFEVLYIASRDGNLVTSYPPTEAGIEILTALRSR